MRENCKALKVDIFNMLRFLELLCVFWAAMNTRDIAFLRATATGALVFFPRVSALLATGAFH